MPTNQANLKSMPQIDTNASSSVPTLPAAPPQPDPSALILTDIIGDDSIQWQVHNCKILEKTVTQDTPLPFLYHYDTLTDDLKAANPLTSNLLKRFNCPMSTEQAANLLGIDKNLIIIPWQVKVLGTLVMFCERLQIALRLKFTNTAKDLDPIYSQTPKDALQIAMKDWHFYGDVFVLNKYTKPIAVTDNEQHWAVIERADNYQALNPIYGLSILATLEVLKESQTLFDDAISLRLDGI